MSATLLQALQHRVLRWQ